MLLESLGLQLSMKNQLSTISEKSERMEQSYFSVASISERPAYDLWREDRLAEEFQPLFDARHQFLAPDGSIVKGQTAWDAALDYAKRGSAEWILFCKDIRGHKRPTWGDRLINEVHGAVTKELQQAKKMGTEKETRQEKYQAKMLEMVLRECCDVNAVPLLHGGFKRAKAFIDNIEKGSLNDLIKFTNNLGSKLTKQKYHYTMSFDQTVDIKKLDEMQFELKKVIVKCIEPKMRSMKENWPENKVEIKGYYKKMIKTLFPEIK